MDPEARPAPQPMPHARIGEGGLDERGLRARVAALEEAVSLALFASAWLQHAGKDPHASNGARVVAKLLAACSGQPSLQGPDAFAAARRFLEDEHA